MNRPTIICHMLTSLDGKVTGDFLLRPECEAATEIYYRINCERRADGFICGRVTMEGSFTGGYVPDLARYAPVQHGSQGKQDYIADDRGDFYAIAFDTHGSLGWRSSRIVDPDGDPGYDGAHIVEVLSEQVDDRYLGYLRALGISYLFAGERAIDVEIALYKLKMLLGCQTLLLEGGSILNGAFERADAVDEISLVVAPVVGDKDSKPLFMDADIADYALVSAACEQGNMILRYRGMKP